MYKTAGNSSARINQTLLSYSEESIVFIMIHEAVHQHFTEFYCEHQEAVCDLIANIKTIKFAQINNIISCQKALIQQKTIESIIQCLKPVIDIDDNSKINVSTNQFLDYQKLVCEKLAICENQFP